MLKGVDFRRYVLHWFVYFVSYIPPIQWILIYFKICIFNLRKHIDFWEKEKQSSENVITSE